MGCDIISNEIYLGLNIDVDLFKELENQSFENDLPLADVIQNYIRVGLKGDENMQTICLTDEVMEKVNIRCKQVDSTPDDLVNEIVFENLRKIEEIPDDIDGDKIWNMLEHDKPEGDDILKKFRSLSNCNRL